MTEMFYVIRGTEDGDVYVTEHTATDLRHKLASGYWGEGESAPKWLASCPGENLNETEGAFIIKGRVVQPVPVDVVREWELP
jgi:hypothetical protein